MEQDNKVESLPPAALCKAIEALWQIRLPGSHNLFSTPEFIRLRDTCGQLYPNACSGRGTQDDLDFALSEALKALGLPGRPPPASRNWALSTAAAAARLHAAFQQSKARRAYLCPLDKAGELPELRFGPNRIARLTPTELENVIDQPRLRRINPTWAIDSNRFSQFTWLLVGEASDVAGTVAERWDRGFAVNYGAIEPHRRKFSAPVEDALFAMLLAPWEDWSVWAKIGNWRCFEVPWVYETTDDLFVEIERPPAPESLSWEPPDIDDEIDALFTRPEHNEIGSSGSQLLKYVNETKWADVKYALAHPLFKAPISHFFVKAFLEDPLDEFIAHLITIEAALGLQDDPDGEKTGRVAKRISKLLTKKEGDTYRALYKLRSSFLHGRELESISADDRIAARRLARNIVAKLIVAARKNPGVDSREGYFKGLDWRFA